ncbi:hypothetical protein JCM4914_04610 [Streptomyces platensis subsp. malvinus]
MLLAPASWKGATCGASDGTMESEKTGKWPCPAGGVPPRGPGSSAEAGPGTLVHEAGPDEYDCPKR